MEDNNKNNQNQFQMGINPEVAEGIYSNLALITHSSSDFILDFACALPGMPQPQIKSRVILAPEHAKRLFDAYNKCRDRLLKAVAEGVPLHLAAASF